MQHCWGRKLKIVEVAHAQGALRALLTIYMLYKAKRHFTIFVTSPQCRSPIFHRVHLKRIMYRTKKLNETFRKESKTANSLSKAWIPAELPRAPLLTVCVILNFYKGYTSLLSRNMFYSEILSYTICLRGKCLDLSSRALIVNLIHVIGIYVQIRFEFNDNLSA